MDTNAHESIDERQARRIAENMGYVVREAGRRAKRHPSVAIEDLIQEGLLAIVMADERFDGSHGCRFLTYACHWIRQRMDRWVMNNAKTVRLPTYQWRPGGIFTSQVSIDEPLFCDSDQTLADVLPVDETVTEAAETADIGELLEEALAQLKPAQARTLRKRFFENKLHREYAALRKLRQKTDILRKAAA
jgi:RNA polymerase sigma factor (sigma-70 family)